MHLADVYYSIGAVSFLCVFIRVVYGWFRDFDNSQQFASDMAQIHLPYIYDTLIRIADKLDLEPKMPPPVNFSFSKHQT